MEEKTGIEKAREVAAKIKGEVQEENAKVEEKKQEAVAELRAQEIKGFEDIADSDIMRVSYVRIVQPTSQKIEMEDGKDATPGYFFFNDTNEAVETLEICYLKGKMVDVQFTKKDGTIDVQRQLKLLAITVEDKKVIILTLAPTSFGSFGKFKTELKRKGAGAGYEYKTLLSTHKEENDKGKYYVVDFEVGEKNSEQELISFAQTFNDYAGVLEVRRQASLSQSSTPPVLEAGEDTEDIPF